MLVVIPIVNTGFAARLFEHFPKYNVDAALVSNVNRDCQPVGPNDFESFQTAFMVGANLSVATGVHFGFEGLFPDPLAALGFPDTYDGQFFNKETPVFPSTDGQLF